uniref:Lysine-specific demethylase 9-like n=1 Tax=Diabrotica virgifera virgifera TaxID=50390 RepID=A0A6P7FFV1_DIAVI
KFSVAPRIPPPPPSRKTSSLPQDSDIDLYTELHRFGTRFSFPDIPNVPPPPLKKFGLGGASRKIEETEDETINSDQFSTAPRIPPPIPPRKTKSLPRDSDIDLYTELLRFNKRFSFPDIPNAPSPSRTKFGLGGGSRKIKDTKDKTINSDGKPHPIPKFPTKPAKTVTFSEEIVTREFEGESSSSPFPIPPNSPPSEPATSLTPLKSILKKSTELQTLSTPELITCSPPAPTLITPTPVTKALFTTKDDKNQDKKPTKDGGKETKPKKGEDIKLKSLNDKQNKGKIKPSLKDRHSSSRSK